MLKMRNLKRSFRRDSGDAFLPDPANGTFFPVDAEFAAEEFIASVTSASSVLEDSRNELSMDEIGERLVDDDDDDDDALELPD